MVKSWLLDRVVGIACLSGRAESVNSPRRGRKFWKLRKRTFVNGVFGPSCFGTVIQGSRISLRLRGHQFVEPDADLQCSPFRSVYFLALMGRLATHKLRCSGIILCDEFRAIRYTYFRNM